MPRKALTLRLRNPRKHPHLQHPHVGGNPRLTHNGAPAVAAEKPLDAFTAACVGVGVDFERGVLVLVCYLLSFDGEVGGGEEAGDFAAVGAVAGGVRS